MLNEKSNSATNNLVTQKDLSLISHEINSSEDTFPKIKFKKMGNVVNLVINGQQTGTSRGGVYKAYHIPTFLKPSNAFSSLFKSNSLKDYSIEINENSVRIRSFADTDNTNWISICLTYISDIFGGGLRSIQKFRTFIKRFSLSVKNFRKEGLYA